MSVVGGRRRPSRKGFAVRSLSPGARRLAVISLVILSFLANSRAADPLPKTEEIPAQHGEVRKKILFFSKCSQYEDPMVRRVDGQLSCAERIVSEIGKRNGLEFTFTKDGSVFTPGNLAQYDAFCFFTSGDLTQSGSDGSVPMTPAGKAALLQAVSGGKGFVGIHSAADTFNSGSQDVDPYIQMLGGELRVRVRGMEPAHQIVVDTNFPGLAEMPANFGPVEEWYALRNFSPNLHVLLVQDTGSMVRGSYYAPDYPSTWVQPYGRGRVFYTSMGHQEEVWKSPVFEDLLAGGFKWAAGLVKADVTPNINQVAPSVITR